MTAMPAYFDVPQRLTSPEMVNAIADGLALDGKGLRFDHVLDDVRNVVLYDGGVAFCIWSAPRVYECHLLYPQSVRGGAAVAASRRMADFMLTHHADMLWGYPPLNDKAAHWHIRRAGFDCCGTGSHPIVGPVAFFKRTV